MPCCRRFFHVQRTGSRERAFIAETAYAVLRRKRLLERLVGSDRHARADWCWRR